jgi:hypothetical protein
MNPIRKRNVKQVQTAFQDVIHLHDMSTQLLQNADPLEVMVYKYIQLVDSTRN